MALVIPKTLGAGQVNKSSKMREEGGKTRLCLSRGFCFYNYLVNSQSARHSRPDNGLFLLLVPPGLIPLVPTDSAASASGRRSVCRELPFALTGTGPSLITALSPGTLPLVLALHSAICSLSLLILQWPHKNLLNRLLYRIPRDLLCTVSFQERQLKLFNTVISKNFHRG